MSRRRKLGEFGLAALVGCCLVLGVAGTASADGMEGSAPAVSSSTKDSAGRGRLNLAKQDSKSPTSTPARARSKQNGNTSPLSEFELAKYQYCGQDSDCVVAINGCCDCVNGGVEVAVNKDRVEAFRSRFECLRVACGDKLADPPCANGVVSCINHSCKYFDDRPREQF